MAGRVEAVGKDVKRFQPGDEVYGDLCRSGWGGFAEYACAREDEASAGEAKRWTHFMRERFEAGTVRPVIERTFSLSEVPEALRHLGAGRPRGKLVVVL